VRLPTSFVYLACVLDAYSQRCVGWKLSSQIDTQLTLDALAMALAQRHPAPGLIHHADRGVQYASLAYVARLEQAGARGCVLKDADLETIFQAMRRAANGEMLVQPDVIQRLLSHAERALSASGATTKERAVTLTAREQDILAGVARGERSEEIALRLGLSERTIWAHLTTIYNKLGVDSRASAVAVAMEHGLLPKGGEQG
jgi:DNA-binding CsgD family transcriptional regulator